MDDGALAGCDEFITGGLVDDEALRVPWCLSLEDALGLGVGCQLSGLSDVDRGLQGRMNLVRF